MLQPFPLATGHRKHFRHCRTRSIDDEGSKSKKRNAKRKRKHTHTHSHTGTWAFETLLESTKIHTHTHRNTRSLHLEFTLPWNTALAAAAALGTAYENFIFLVTKKGLSVKSLFPLPALAGTPRAPRSTLPRDPRLSKTVGGNETVGSESIVQPAHAIGNGGFQIKISAPTNGRRSGRSCP